MAVSSYSLGQSYIPTFFLQAEALSPEAELSWERRVGCLDVLLGEFLVQSNFRSLVLPLPQGSSSSVSYTHLRAHET